MTLPVNPDSIIFEEGNIIGGFLSGEDCGEDIVSRFDKLLPGREVLRGHQVHGHDLALLLSPQSISDFTSLPHKERCFDGLITDKPGKVLVIRTADCVPILFHTATGDALVGALHCGWKPLAKGIIHSTLSRLSSLKPNGTGRYSASNLKFRIGPAICRDCYEVGEEVFQTFEKMVADLSTVSLPLTHKARNLHKVSKDSKKYLLDLKGLCRLLLLQEGVHESAISISPVCTRCDPAFHSHRENQTAHRNINFISINP